MWGKGKQAERPDYLGQIRTKQTFPAVISKNMENIHPDAGRRPVFNIKGRPLQADSNISRGSMNQKYSWLLLVEDCLHECTRK